MPTIIVTEFVKSTESKHYFTLRDEMLGEYQSTLANSSHLCAAGLLVYGHEAPYSLYTLPSFELAAKISIVLGRTMKEGCIDAHMENIARLREASSSIAYDSLRVAMTAC